MILIIASDFNNLESSLKRYGNYKIYNKKENGLPLMGTYLLNLYNDPQKEIVVIDVNCTKVAYTTSFVSVINEFPISTIINIGNCSSITNSNKILDLVISCATIQYDVNFTPFGYQKGVLPSINNINSFVSNEDLVKDALIISESICHQVNVAKIASGDRFIINERLAKRIANDLCVDYLDVDSGTIGELSYKYGISFVSIKSISNYTNEYGVIDYCKHKDEANEIALDIGIKTAKCNFK